MQLRSVVSCQARLSIWRQCYAARNTILHRALAPPVLSRTFSRSSEFAKGSSSSSSQRWKTRQDNDHFAREARVLGLRSRAAFKLLEINEKYKIFKKGQTVVDLGYAPGSWSQVAFDRTSPGCRVIGIDIIPAQPPKGVSTIQGNFLSPRIQDEVKNFLSEPDRGRIREQRYLYSKEEDEGEEIEDESGDHDSHKDVEDKEHGGMTEDELAKVGSRYFETESLDIQHSDVEVDKSLTNVGDANGKGKLEGKVRKLTRAEEDLVKGRMVDVVLSDMCEPWEQTSGFYKRSLSDPYHRMMNTSGLDFRDHYHSMDLCEAALTFAYDTLRTGGHFVCKFYDGSESKKLENKLRILFSKVARQKPSSSRSASKEAFLVALRRKPDVTREKVFGDSKEVPEDLSSELE